MHASRAARAQACRATPTAAHAAALAALLALPALVALPEIERQAVIIQTDVLGKDARLTGRTLLWEEADSLIAQAPLVGHGYKAIWLGPKGKGLMQNPLRGSSAPSGD